MHARRLENVIARLSKLLNTECKMKMFNAFILSNLSYCSMIYHYCNMKDSIKLEKIQKRALRYVLNDFESSYSELLATSKRDSLYVCRIRNIIECVFKIIHNALPPLESSFFIKNTHGYSLRMSQTIKNSQVNTTHFGLNSLKFNGSNLGNMIPETLRNTEHPLNFKKRLSEWKHLCQCNSCKACKLINI